MYGTANGRRMSVSGRQRRQGRSFINAAFHKYSSVGRNARHTQRSCCGGAQCVAYTGAKSVILDCLLLAIQEIVITLYTGIGVSSARFLQYFDS